MTRVYIFSTVGAEAILMQSIISNSKDCWFEWHGLKYKPVKHAESVRAIGELLEKMVAFNDKNGFVDNNAAMYAQGMGHCLKDALFEFLNNTKDFKTNSNEYQVAHLNFNTRCERVIRANIKGFSQEPTLVNCLLSLVNQFLKLIGQKPFQLETTAIAKDKSIKESFFQLKSQGIAVGAINEVDSTNDYRISSAL